jgi:peptidoglycan/xylan/chitin deacetylase (PgdA/CDA1 family)
MRSRSSPQEDLTMPGEPNVTDAVSRRSMLRLGAGGLLLGAALAPLDALFAGSAAAATPSYEQRWNTPISSIAEFRRRSPHTSFPRRAIMLTVDDGPSPEWTPKYLRLFAKHRVRATFCMIGSQVHANPGLARAVLDHGHVIANHSWNHDEAMGRASASHIHWEVEAAQRAIHDATGFLPNTFRNPGGLWSGAVLAELANQHMMPLGWNVDPRDWARPGVSAIESAMLQVRPSGIILCHDGGGDRSQTFAALQNVIPKLLHRGFRFVTLPVNATKSPPRSDGGPHGR